MIYTSYFGRVRELQRNGIVPIAISRSVPKGFPGIRLLALAPTWAMLKMSDEDYNREYERILAQLDRDEIVRSFGGRDVALLCWEKDVNECHRKRVGEWLREGGYEAREFGEAQQKPKETVAAREKEKEQAEPQIRWEQLSLLYPPLA